MPSKNVTVNGICLNVLDEGQGTPILFVHGFPLSHKMWQGQFSLADRFRILIPDLRGFGSSEVVPGKTTMTQLAEDCAGLLDALDVREPVVFCGLSMGGYVAWQFMKRYAARLRGLVLCDTKAAGDTPEAAETRRKMAEHVLKHGTAAVAEAMPPKLFGVETFRDRPEIVAAVREMILNTAPAGLAAAQLGMAEREDVRSMLPTITTPTLVVVGREDAISPVDEMQKIAEAIPGAKFHVVEGAGHMAPMELPKQFNAALASFVESLI